VTDVGSVVAFDCNYNKRILLLLLFYLCIVPCVRQYQQRQ